MEFGADIFKKWRAKF